MNFYLILTLAFLQSTLSITNNFGRSSNISKLKWKTTKIHCKHFKCPPVEDLVCVRMRRKKIGTNTKDVYMVLLNKCEMEYMKCHEGFRAAEVSMKYCGYHEKLQKPLARSKRSIRQGSMHQPKLPINRMLGTLVNSQSQLWPSLGLLQGIRGPAARDLSNSSEGDNTDNQDPSADRETEIVQPQSDKGASQSHTEDESDGKESNEIHDVKMNIIDIEKVTQNSIKKHKNKQSNTKQNNSDELSEDENEDVDENVNEDVNEDVDENEDEDEGGKQSEVENREDKNEAKIEQDNSQNYPEKVKINLETKIENNDMKTDKENNVEDVHDNSELPQKGNNFEDDPVNEIPENKEEKSDSDFPVDYDLKAANEGVDFEEYQKDCPAFCPAREVMICARCKDGIYRTFMSVCHLRMFNCGHPDEEAELISRYPCILSAPYHAEAPAPKGRVAEPGDVDEILRFIRCRRKEELGRGDPKCKFVTKKPIKKL